MNSKKPLISLALLITVGVGGYFVVTGIQLRQSELEVQEYFKNNPKARIGLWNKSNKRISLKLTNENGQLRWFHLDPSGGSIASYDIGNVRIERIFSENSLYSVNLELQKGAEINFNVYEDRIEPR